MTFVRKLSVVLVALLSTLTGAGGTPEFELEVRSDTVSGDIIGGVPARAHEFPYIVTSTNKGDRWCGGMLINPYTVLNAGHCSYWPFSNLTADLFQVRAGSLSGNSSGIVVNISQTLTHPEYDYDSGRNDIGLWRLSDPIYESPDICYATLPEQGANVPHVGTDVIVAGWGTTNASGGLDYPQFLQKVEIPVVSHDTCEAVYDRYKDLNRTITPAMFCAGFEEGGKGSCRDDSGGPVIEAVSKLLVGIVAFGTPTERCAIKDGYDVFTRISSFVDWINANKFHSGIADGGN